MPLVDLPNLGAAKKVKPKVKTKQSSAKITHVRKRDGSLEIFKPSKIRDAILKAFVATEVKNGAAAERVASAVVTILEEKFSGRVPSVEQIQDIVEEQLIKAGHAK